MQNYSARDQLLGAGLRLMRQQGYRKTGVRAIVVEAGAVQGSFGTHFLSKEAFGLEVLEIHYHEHYQLI